MVPGFLLRGQATIEPYAGNLGDGPSYGMAATVAAVVTSTKLVGKDSSAGVQAKVILAAGTAVKPGDRLTIDGQQMKVRAVTNPGGPLGGHLEVTGDTRQ